MGSARVGEGEGDLEEPDTLGVVALEVVEALEVVAMEEVVLGVAIWGLGPLVFLVPGGASKR